MFSNSREQKFNSIEEKLDSWNLEYKFKIYKPTLKKVS